MARIQIPDDAALELLNYLLRWPLDPDPAWEFALWRGTHVPTKTTVWANLTECDFAGYTRRSVDREVWEDPALLAGVPTCVYGPTRQEWTAGVGGATVNGWAMIDPVGPKLLAVQRSDAELVAAAGEVVWVHPRLALSTLLVC